jgi:hypothetical protein
MASCCKPAIALHCKKTVVRLRKSLMGRVLLARPSATRESVRGRTSAAARHA